MFEYARSDDCLVCSRKEAYLEVSETELLKDFTARISEQMKLKGPQIKGLKGFLVGRGIFAAEAEPKFELTFGQLLDQGHIVQDERMEMTDKSLPGLIILKLHVLKDNNKLA